MGVNGICRSNPDFRSEMYSILGSEVQSDDFELGPNVTDVLISNPDVEHHNSSRDFSIGGETRRCTVVFYATAPFEKPVDNYWEVFGENTGYTIDPEEVLADNFSFAVVYGRDGREYKSPWIIDEIFSRLGKN